MAQTPFFNFAKTNTKQKKIQLRPSTDENECGSLFEHIPICVGARVICRRNLDFDGGMVNGTEATVKDIVWEKDDDFVLPMCNQSVFPKLERIVRTVLPKHIELGTEINIGLKNYKECL